MSGAVVTGVDDGGGSPALSLRTMTNAALHPRWWFDLLTTEPLEFASLRSWGGSGRWWIDNIGC